MEQITQDSPVVKSELIRIVFSAVPQSLIGILVSSSILAYIQLDFIEHTTILIWYVLTNSLSIVRYIVYKKFNVLDKTIILPSFWGQFILFSSIASGASWAAAGIWLFPPDDVVHQALLALVLAGMCAGAVGTLAPLISSLVAFLTLAIIPAVIHFMLVGTDIAYLIAIMSLVFVIIVLKTAKNLNLTIKESLSIRQEQRLARELIEHQALYDQLTNLPNRRLLIDKIEHEIEHSTRHKKIGAVLFLDLDHFKIINDSMGHSAGDALLKLIADRLKAGLRKEDTIARLGGDEFVILVSDVGDDIEVANVNIKIFTDKILKLFDKEFDVNNQTINITASIGAAMFPISNATAEELLQKSDVAMYQAKADGRNKMRLFAPEMHQLIISQRETEKGLRKALLEDELELYYQPLFDDNNNIFSVEALIRWHHPEKGLIPPIDFIELAEKRGLIIPIGDWVLEQACKHLAQISEMSDISVSINVSARQFDESTFVEKMTKVLAETGVNPKKVRLEITESMIMDNVEKTINKMKVLTSQGITFSIDDFGTGYSSLAYLKRLPVDLLKIDKSFVLDITNDSNDAVIVETILAMARHMKIDVIAEGVETEKALEFLKSKGCCKFQGYYFKQPMPFNELLNLLSGNEGEYPLYGRSTN